MTEPFENYRSPKKTHSGRCIVCDEPSAGRVHVDLKAKGKRPNSQKYYPTIVSTSRSFCEQHAVEVYEACCRLVLNDD